eukprot:4182626-Amphidinium_carterae.1
MQHTVQLPLAWLLWDPHLVVAVDVHPTSASSRAICIFCIFPRPRGAAVNSDAVYRAKFQVPHPCVQKPHTEGADRARLQHIAGLGPRAAIDAALKLSVEVVENSVGSRKVYTFGRVETLRSTRALLE